MKIKEWSTAILVGALILAFAYFIFRQRHTDPIQYVNFEQIQVGMTRTEVAELLGCNPCTHENGVTWITLCNYKGPDPRELWVGDTKKIRVTFADERVVGKSMYEKVILAECWISWFQRSVGLRGPVDNTCEFEWVRAD